MSTVSPDLFLDARSVNDPGERALALVRIAQTAIFSRQLEEAHTALFEAGPAALAERNPLIREQRHDRDHRLAAQPGRGADERDHVDVDLATPLDDPTAPRRPRRRRRRLRRLPRDPDASRPSAAKPPSAGPSRPSRRITRLRMALPEWAKAVELADQDRQDHGQDREPLPDRRERGLQQPAARHRPAPELESGGRPDPSTLDPEIRIFTDYLLASAARHASMIERPIWRDYAAFSIISNAATSSQFTRGFQIARAIQQPEARTNALIRLAEGQALNARPNEATAAYEEAARSVTLIPQEDPRETLVGVLIDSLISFGRFDDARACVPLYSFPSRQLTALAAVAESQGRRGLAESARHWIAQRKPRVPAPALPQGQRRHPRRDRAEPEQGPLRSRALIAFDPSGATTNPADGRPRSLGPAVGLSSRNIVDAKSSSMMDRRARSRSADRFTPERSAP